MKLIKQGKKAVNSLFGDDDNVKPDVNQSDVDAAIESVEKIKHKDIAKELMDRINKVKETLKEREQARVQEKKNKEREQKSQEKESTVEKEKKQEKEKTQQVGEAKEVEEDIVYEEPGAQSNADEIRRLEDRYYQLASQRDRLEYEAYQYPTHTQEHRDALEEIIKVLQEMQAIEELLNQLY